MARAEPAKKCCSSRVLRQTFMADSLAERWMLGLCTIAGAMLGLLLAMRPAAADATAASIHTRAEFIQEPVFGGQAYVYQAGIGQTRSVVLIHGIGDKASRDWSRLIPVLALHYHVVTFDLPGFGRSTKGNKLYSPANYVAFVRFVAARYIHGPFDLIGHSLGAAIALRYAATYPNDVRSLVLADVAGILHRMAYSQYLSHLGIDQIPTLYPNQREQLQDLVANALGLLERLRPDQDLLVDDALLRREFLDSDPAKIAGLALVLDDFSDIILRVQAPTLLVWGDRDPIAPLRTAEVLLANIPQARLKILHNCGHTPMDDRPLEFRDIVLQALQNPGPTREVALQFTASARGVPASKRTGSCRDQRNRVFEGNYDTIHIHDCRDVRIRNAQIRELDIDDASVQIDGSHIGGNPGGLIATDANVTVTGGSISAPIAITASDSHLDLAGVTLNGSEAAVRAPQRSRILFSVSYLHSRYSNGSAHGMWIVGPHSPL